MSNPPRPRKQVVDGESSEEAQTAGGREGEAALSREALRHLSDEDLDALEDALEAGQENGTATFEDLYRVVTERGQRALENFFECIDALREDRESPSSPKPESRTQSRNGYRIWKYYRK